MRQRKVIYPPPFNTHEECELLRNIAQAARYLLFYKDRVAIDVGRLGAEQRLEAEIEVYETWRDQTLNKYSLSGENGGQFTFNTKVKK